MQFQFYYDTLIYKLRYINSFIPQLNTLLNTTIKNINKINKVVNLIFVIMNSNCYFILNEIKIAISTDFINNCLFWF